MWKKFLAASAVAIGIAGLLGGGSAFAATTAGPYTPGQELLLATDYNICVQKSGGYAGDSIIADIRGTNYEKQLVFDSFTGDEYCTPVTGVPADGKLKYVAPMGISEMAFVQYADGVKNKVKLNLNDATVSNKYLRSYGQSATRIEKSSATINFDANGGSGAVPVVSGIRVGTSVTLPKNQLTRTDYRFGGWNTKADGTGTAYEDEAVISITEAGTLQLYAQWIADVAVLDYGTSVNGKLKTAAGTVWSGRPYNTTDYNIKAVKKASALPESFDTDDPANIISSNYSPAKIYAWFDNGDINEGGDGDGVIYIYSDASTIRGGSSTTYMFGSMGSLADISALAEWDMSNTINLSWMFESDGKLSDISALANWNTSSVEYISYFLYYTKATSLDALETVQRPGNDYVSWDMSKVTEMNSVFAGDSSLVDISALSTWDTSSAMYMRSLFFGDSSLVDISALSAWNTSKVKTMDTMFYSTAITSTEALKTVQREGNNYVSWDVSKVEDMSDMFMNCASLVNISDLASWNVQKVADMGSMFQGATALSNISSIAKWNTASITNISAMFQATAITSAEALRTMQHEGNDYVSWDMSNVTSMRDLFFEARSLSDIAALATWNTASVKNMSQMFCKAGLISDITALTNWNTSIVENMSGMFREATSLTSITPLTDWDTSNVKDMAQLFYLNTAVTDLSALRYWNTSSLKYLNFAFSETKITDTNALRTMQHEGKDYISWNVSGVTDLSCIFERTNTLTDVSALESWNIQSGTGMTRAFNGVAVPAASLPSWYQQ